MGESTQSLHGRQASFLGIPQLLSNRAAISHLAMKKVNSETPGIQITGLRSNASKQKRQMQPRTPRAHTSFHSGAETLGCASGMLCHPSPPGPGPGAIPVLTARLRCPDAKLLGRVLPTAQSEGLPIRQVEEHFHPWLGGLQIHLGLLGAPHFSTESHSIAVLFYV